MERANSSSSSNLYCTACKKKFSNEATWSTHLKSAKHIQNEKASAKSANVQLSASQRSKSSGQLNPAVTQVSMKLKQAMSVAASKPSRAVGALWTLAQEFYKLKRPRDAAQVLNDLIDLLESLQSQTAKVADADTLTSAQISGTLYLSRLALSRLYLIYWDDQSLELARKLFVRALHGKWKIDEQQLNELAANCSGISITKSLKAAEDLLRIYIDKVLSKPAKSKADVNQMLPVILSEGEMLFSLPLSQTRKPREFSKCASPQQIAVAMCAMTIVIDQHTKNNEGELNGYQGLSKLYLNLGAQGSAAEALMERSLIAARQCDFDGLPSSAMVDAMIALIICLEIDDIVRAQEIIRRAAWHTTFEDIRVLLSLADAVIDSNHLYIRQVIYYQIAHVRLLLRTHDSAVRLLLFSTESSQRMPIWNRIERVVSKFML
ncbi:unnamed protein product [Umbelopsis ramanniana]